ncbi:hypothetical protein WR25_14000 [Diploscapter pachys]|uniref:Uncharacterized protein n=1 Tax=Diploscapter pachys TaxID=2018661 RepID=A0A2A2KVA1_9BILA|nr:hypothetical protein WR25_14000 [Diploscapter pachys]
MDLERIENNVYFASMESQNSHDKELEIEAAEEREYVTKYHEGINCPEQVEGEILLESDVDDFRRTSNVAADQEQIIAVAEQRGYEDDDEVGRELDAEIHVPKYSPPSPPQVQDRNIENRSPPTYHTKKGAVIWPPVDEQNKAAKDAGDDDVKALPKKRVSDLIARFNSGSIESGSGNKDVKYKSEYGATGQVNRLQVTDFR